MSVHDVVIIGAGHNGLTLGAYLAKAGLGVAIVERNPFVGGGVVTRERVSPGFLFDIHSTVHILILANPLIERDELGLVSRHGLTYLLPDLMVGAPTSDGRAIRIYRDIDKTCESLAQFSQRDAEAYRALYGRMLPGLDSMLQGFFRPPPSLSGMLARMESQPGGGFVVRLFLSTAREMIESHFESDPVRAFFAKWSSEFMQPPNQIGSGRFFLLLPFYHRFGVGLPVGGSGALSESLARCVTAFGGVVRTDAPVARIKCVRGKATGVLLESGEEIEARRAVVATVNVKQLYLQMLEGEIGPEMLGVVRGVQSSDFVRYKLHAALNRLPGCAAGNDLLESGFLEVVGSYQELLDGFHEVTNGRIARPPMGTAGFPTTVDGTRAPHGKHILWFEGYAPARPKAVSWNSLRKSVAQETVEFLRRFFPDLDRSIEGFEMDTPEDMEKFDPCFIGGDIMHIRSDLSQSLALRPFPGLPPYRTPVQHLYLCGPSTHPGGGVSGGSRTAAQVILEELGVDPAKVMVV